MQVGFQPKRDSAMSVVVVTVVEGGRFSGRAAELDASLGGALSRALKAPHFTAKREQILDILAPGATGPRRVLIAGLGAAKEISPQHLREVGGAIAAHLMAAKEPAAAVLVDLPQRIRLDEPALAANLALGARLRNYQFGKYRTKEKPDRPKLVRKLSLVTDHPAAAAKLMQRFDAVADGVLMARDLTNEPPNELYPEIFAARARELAKLGVKVEVLNEAQMAKLGMNAILAVGGGSKRPPRLLVLRYLGAGRSGKGTGPIALVGKGVCFDSGGLCLKRANQMITMKGDMAGGAAVVGTIRALAQRKAKIDVVGVVGLVENLPSSSAYKPGDIIKTMSGQTIEVIDTDAEGRVVLVDALYYAATRFKPRCIIDLATLTYSVTAALGGAFAGVFSTRDRLAQDIIAAGEAVGERFWRLPIDDYYDHNLDSPIADFRHHAADDESADAAHAAALMKHFVDGCDWAHLDIANKEFAHKDRALCPVGGTGFGVALLEEFAAKIEGIA